MRKTFVLWFEFYPSAFATIENY